MAINLSTCLEPRGLLFLGPEAAPPITALLRPLFCNYVFPRGRERRENAPRASAVHVNHTSRAYISRLLFRRWDQMSSGPSTYCEILIGCMFVWAFSKVPSPRWRACQQQSRDVRFFFYCHSFQIRRTGSRFTGFHRFDRAVV